MATHSNITPSGVHATGLPSHPPLADLIAREKLRAKIERAVAKLIDALDAMDTDPDLEPSLGAAEINATCRATVFTSADGWHHVPVAQEEWAQGANDDREEIDEDGTDLDRGEHDPCDLEPSLGAAQNHHDQRHWSQGDRHDLELVNEDGGDHYRRWWENVHA